MRSNLKQAIVYIITNQRNGTLYIGVTSNIVRRILEHKNKSKESFTSRYDLNTLVYYELANTMRAAITREKQLKKWKRKWKIRLIEELNPSWEDLFPALFENGLLPPQE